MIRGITWLSTIGIFFSVTAFLIVVFVMNGMNDSIRDRILALEPHLVVEVSEAKSANYIESLPVWMRLQEFKGVQKSVYESQDVIVRTMEGLFRGAAARGISKGSLELFATKLQQVNKRTGFKSDVLSIEDLPASDEVLIGVNLAHSIGVFEGDYLNVIAPESLLLPPGQVPHMVKVRVKKIVSTGVSELDATLLYYQIGTSLTSLARESRNRLGIEVWTEKEEDVEVIAQDLRKFDEVRVETWKERNSAIFWALKLEKSMIGIFLGLAGLIAGSSVLTVLSLLISQKRRDIALLQTIGLSSSRAVKLFTEMGLLLSGSAVLAGIVVGTGVGLFIQYHPLDVLPAIYIDSQIPAHVEFGLVFLVFVLSSILTFLGSWWPARVSAWIKPAETLRAKN